MENSEVSEKLSSRNEFLSPHKEGRMSFTAEAIRSEMSGRVADVVRLYSPDGSVKARLRWASRMLGLSVSRVSAYLYGEARRVEAHEADQIRARYDLARQQYRVRIEAEYRALQAEVVAEAPYGLGWLCPPSLGEEAHEVAAGTGAENTGQFQSEHRRPRHRARAA